MTGDELEARLRELPPIAPLMPQEQLVRAAQPSPMRELLSSLRPGPEPLPDGKAAAAELDLARQRWQERVRSEQAALAPRIHRRILAALARTPTCCALLLGPTNVGKTSAMHWLAARWRGYQIHARELGSSERRHGLGEGYPPEMQRARAAPVLYLDDIGAEEARDLTALQFMLDYRYSHGLPMVATTGLTEPELLEHLGAAYFRRLVDQHAPRRSGGEWPVLMVNLHD